MIPTTLRVAGKRGGRGYNPRPAGERSPAGGIPHPELAFLTICNKTSFWYYISYQLIGLRIIDDDLIAVADIF